MTLGTSAYARSIERAYSCACALVSVITLFAIRMADVVHVLFGESLSSHDLGELTLFRGVVYVSGAIGAIANPTLFTTSVETQLHKKKRAHS